MKLSVRMGIPIKQLLEQMDSEEFTWYLAMERLDPLPDTWTQNAINCHVTACAMGAKKSKVENYLITKKKAKPQSAEELRAAFKALCKQ